MKKTTTKNLWTIYRRMVREDTILLGVESEMGVAAYSVYHRHNMRREFELKLNNIIVELCHRLDCSEEELNKMVWNTLATMEQLPENGMPVIYSQHDLRMWKKANLPKTEALRQRYADIGYQDEPYTMTRHRLHMYCTRHRINYRVGTPPPPKSKQWQIELPF